jgi:hypothetical protein
MSRVKHPARSKRKNDGGHAGAVGVKTGCPRPRVAPATPKCTSEPQRRPQSRAAKPARVSARTLDGGPTRRLTAPDSSLTSNTVAHATVLTCVCPDRCDALTNARAGLTDTSDDHEHEPNTDPLPQILTIAELRLVRNLFRRSIAGRVDVIASDGVPHPGCATSAHGCHEISLPALDYDRLVWH